MISPTIGFAYCTGKLANDHSQNCFSFFLPPKSHAKNNLLAHIYWNFLEYEAKTRLNFGADWQQIPLQKNWGHKIIKLPKLQGFQKGRNGHLYFTGKDPELLQKSQRPIEGNAIPVKGCYCFVFNSSWKWNAATKPPLQMHWSRAPELYFGYCLKMSFHP